MDKESSAASIDRVATKIPPFWARNPELWFRQVESQFALSGITNDDTKFHYVTGNLDARYAEDVRDILVDPPETGKYQLLKTELIRRLGTSQEKKTRQLFEQEEMGDRKPSQFLRHLRGLAGTAVLDELLKTIWLGRIPASMRTTGGLVLTRRDANRRATSVRETIRAVANGGKRPEPYVPPLVRHGQKLQEGIFS
ncbi:hypothetical protein ALC56_09493 [Trachymyrmex septentrionalis]|uniref:DUF7041 domain-containing protein n=1 Tax=Trachymyrmex septentrionalis TaxID=34720 RepID=A0A151JUB8_9HYME|nr:hypothetical protein ALC56_09493 [Trachymyrmex septentrionalis]